MKKSFLFIGLFLLLLLLVPLVTAQLQIGFYNSTCPRAELIVGKVIQERFIADHTITAAFLRMHFHDCFVRVRDFLFPLLSSLFSFLISKAILVPN